jgi:hypothetical protein
LDPDRPPRLAPAIATEAAPIDARSPEPLVREAGYRCAIITPEKTFTTTSFLDADGVSVRIKVSAPIGSMSVILE